jgi:hypothetical protein
LLIDRGAPPASRTIAVVLAAKSRAERVRVGRRDAVTSETIHRVARRVVRFLGRYARRSPLAGGMRVRRCRRDTPALRLSVVAVRARSAVALARADRVAGRPFAGAIVDTSRSGRAPRGVASRGGATRASKDAR